MDPPAAKGLELAGQHWEESSFCCKGEGERIEKEVQPCMCMLQVRGSQWLRGLRGPRTQKGSRCAAGREQNQVFPMRKSSGAGVERHRMKSGMLANRANVVTIKGVNRESCDCVLESSSHFHWSTSSPRLGLFVFLIHAYRQVLGRRTPSSSTCRPSTTGSSSTCR